MRAENYGKCWLGIVFFFLVTCITPSSMYAANFGADFGNINIFYSTNGCNGCPVTFGGLSKTSPFQPGYYDYLKYTEFIDNRSLIFNYSTGRENVSSVEGPRGDYGSVHIDTGGSISNGIIHWNSIVDGTRNGYEAFVRANATTELFWNEAFRFVGPQSTAPVEYRLDLSLVASGNCTDCDYASVGTSVSGWLIDGLTGEEKRFASSGGLDFTLPDPGQARIGELVIRGYDGDFFFVKHTFGISTAIVIPADPTPLFPSGDANINAKAMVDARHTSLFYLDPITPGAGYISDSGIDYRTGARDLTQLNPVPEPATIVLLGFGLLGLAAWRWKYAA